MNRVALSAQAALPVPREDTKDERARASVQSTRINRVSDVDNLKFREKIYRTIPTYAAAMAACAEKETSYQDAGLAVEVARLLESTSPNLHIQIHKKDIHSLFELVSLVSIQMFKSATRYTIEEDKDKIYFCHHIKKEEQERSNKLVVATSPARF